jgi:DNA ligase-1
MRLAELAAAVDRLAGTRSRLRMVDEIATLLRQAERDERAPIVYLLQAQLRPPYEGVQIGVGEKLLIKAIAHAYGAGEAMVLRRFKRAGDLGLVAEVLAPPEVRRRMSVRDAYNALLAVARAQGTGSIERKTSSLAMLLRGLSGIEAKVVVRVTQGRLRLGVGDQTILEAAALGALGDRGKRALLEHAYNIRADLGRVVGLAFTKGERGLTDVTPEIGTPVRPALAQRLPSARSILDRLGEVQVEPKYDGFRLQIHRDGPRVWIFSRRLENVTDMFPELAKAARRQLETRRAIIEGEALAHNPETGEFLPFQITMTRKRKTRIAETAARYPLRLFAFDLLYAGRKSYLPLPQRERSRALRAVIKSGPDDPITVTEAVMIRREAALEDYFDEMIHRGLEGIMAKRPDAAYQAGARGYAWVKLKRAYQSKLRDTVDLVLVGYLRGRGKRAALGIGSLLAAVYDPTHDRFRTVAKIGSGLSDTGWKELRALLDERATRRRPPNVDSLITPDVWVDPTYVVEVLADEITRSPFHTCGKSGSEPGYALRFPRLVNGIRTDKAPADATSEREILDLYRQQRTGRERPGAPRAATHVRVRTKAATASRVKRSRGG